MGKEVRKPIRVELPTVQCCMHLISLFVPALFHGLITGIDYRA